MNLFFVISQLNGLDLRQPKLEQEYWWDVARVTSRDFEIEQMQLRSRTEVFKVIFKLFSYLIFFAIVLGGAVFSKLSLFYMLNAYEKEEQVRPNETLLNSSFKPSTN